MNNKRKISILVLILFVGSILGTLFGDLIAFLLPDGVVKQFFLQSTHLSFSNLLGKDDYIYIDLGSLGLIFGVKLKLNFTSIIGLSISYYFLRYFR